MLRPRSSRIRVLHVGPDPSGRGGMAAVVQNLLTSSLRDSYRFGVVVTWRGGATAVQRLLVFAVAVARLTFWCIGGGRRVVHVHTAARGSLYRKAICILLARALGRPVLLQIHAGPGDIAAFHEHIQGVRVAMLGFAMRRANRLVAVSAASSGAIERAFSVEGVGVVPNAAPTRALDPTPRGPGENDRVEILYLGGFANAIKGGSTLLAALPAILERLPAAAITMAGPGEAPDLPAAAITMAGPGEAPDELGALDEATPSVRWAGWLNGQQKAEALAFCDVFVLPSHSEGLPVALLEAMTYGCAIVASAVGGVPDVVIHEETALLVEPGRADQLAAAAVRLGRSADLRSRLGGAALSAAEQLNDREVYGRLNELYQELAA